MFFFFFSSAEKVVKYHGVNELNLEGAHTFWKHSAKTLSFYLNESMGLTKYCSIMCKRQMIYELNDETLCSMWLFGC